MRLGLAMLFMTAATFCAPPTLFAVEQSFDDYCASTYQKTSECPMLTCQVQCADGTDTEGCPKECIPRECQKISADSCPLDYCRIVIDCSQQQYCLPKTPSTMIPDCGALAYTGQDVPCCTGLVKRCGFDYLDGSCNMEGKNSEYRWPLCIPCGDGVCTNFENHCNCPEDCQKVIIPLK